MDHSNSRELAATGIPLTRRARLQSPARGVPRARRPLQLLRHDPREAPTPVSAGPTQCGVYVWESWPGITTIVAISPDGATLRKTEMPTPLLRERDLDEMEEFLAEQLALRPLRLE